MFNYNLKVSFPSKLVDDMQDEVATVYESGRLQIHVLLCEAL